MKAPKLRASLLNDFLLFTPNHWSMSVLVYGE